MKAMCYHADTSVLMDQPCMAHLWYAINNGVDNIHALQVITGSVFIQDTKLQPQSSVFTVWLCHASADSMKEAKQHMTARRCIRSCQRNKNVL